MERCHRRAPASVGRLTGLAGGAMEILFLFAVVTLAFL